MIWRINLSKPNDGSGNFSKSPFLPAEAFNTQAVATGDVNGDGNVDIIFANDFGLSNQSGLTGAVNQGHLNGSGYTVTLKITDNDGLSDTSTQFIQVTGNEI